MLKPISLNALLVIAVLLSSCGKTTKGKVSNDWKVESYEEVYINANNLNGNQTTTTLIFEGTTYSNHLESSSGYIEHADGTISYNNFQIKKDGTWTSESEISYSYTDAPDIIQKSVKKASGSWSFLGKTKGDDYKKHERIIFHTLFESETETAKDAVTGEEYPSFADFQEYNYLNGQETTIYTVSGSKGKKLVLESKGETNSLDNADSYTYNRTKKMVLGVD